MARNTFGGEITDLVVAPDVADGNALKVTPNVVFPLYDAAGALQNDFMVWDGAEYVAATQISANGSGYVPRFQGPDGATVLYDANGMALVSWEHGGGGAGSGTGLPAGGTTGQALIKQSATDGDAAWATLPSGLSATTYITDNVLNKASKTALQTELEVDTDTLNTRLTEWAAASGRPKIVPLASDAPLPAVENGTILARLAGAVTGGLSVVSVMAPEAIGAIAAAATGTTSGTPPALGAGAVVLAFVSGYQSGATSSDKAPPPGDLDGMGLTWTRIPITEPNNGNGGNFLSIFIGTGTGTATKPVIGDVTENLTGVHIHLVQIVGATGTVLQHASAQQLGGDATPGVSLPGEVSGTGVVVTVIVQNNISNTQTPGTGYTEVGSATSSTGARTSVAYAIPGSRTPEWSTPTTPNQYQKLVAAVEVQ